jgi:hypothetical protein
VPALLVQTRADAAQVSARPLGPAVAWHPSPQILSVLDFHMNENTGAETKSPGSIFIEPGLAFVCKLFDIG